MAQICFASADIYTGIRTSEELVAILDECLIDLVVWCWNPGPRALHGIDMLPEQAADLTLQSSRPWIVAQADTTGAQRIQRFVRCWEDT